MNITRSCMFVGYLPDEFHSTQEMNGNSSSILNNDCQDSLKSSAVTQPGKMKINPLQLLTALSILLNKNGGIKSVEEVKRVAGLMGKYSKKLVSKCIYLNILEATDKDLLDQYYNEMGWDLVCIWLTDAISTRNWPLTKQILNLLLVSPVNVQRLKQNNCTKLVKDISMECADSSIRKIAEEVVQNWKLIVQGTSSILSSGDNYLVTAESDESALALKELNVTPIDETALAEVPNVCISQMGSPTKSPVKRGRGGRIGRGRGRPRGRPKAEAPSYAELLKQDLAGINITIRNGPKILAKVSSKKGKKMDKTVLESVDSTDSEDNMPLSLIRKDGQSTIDLTGEETEVEETGSLINSDSQSMEDELSISAEESIKAKVETSDENEKSENKTKKPKIVDKPSKSKSPKGRDKSPRIKNKVGRKIKEKDESEESVEDKSNEKDISKHKEDASKHKDDTSKHKEDTSKHKEDTSKHKEDTSNHKEDTSKQKEDTSKQKEDTSKQKEDTGKQKEDTGKQKEDTSKQRGDTNKHKDGDKSRDRRKDKERDKRKYNDRHRHSSDRNRDKKSDQSKNKHKSNKSGSSKHHHQSSSRDKKKEDTPTKAKDQTEQDQVTLDKVKPLSIDGLAKIPRKPASFLDALGAADINDTQEQKKPAIKTKSRGFRNTGLLDETINPPGKAIKHNADNTTSPTSGLKRHRHHGLVLPEKRQKTSVSSNPSVLDRPGGVKLISPKRPSIADDGGFMSALTAAVPERKRISKKRRSSDSDSKHEPGKILKLDSTESESEEKSSIDKQASTESVKTEHPLLSPTSIRPVLNFYKETLKDDDEEPKKESDKEIETCENSDKPSESVENEKEECEENELFEKEFAMPAPAQEEYETIEVIHMSPTHNLKGVLVYHGETITKRKKKGVQWKSDENLTRTFFFPMDENERVNVNTLKFQDMMQRDRAFEKELLGKSRGKFGSFDLNPYLADTCKEYMPWKLYPIHLPQESSVMYGGKSKEKHLPVQREQLTMELFFHPMMRPDTPSEPDAEMITRVEPIIVPLSDATGSDSFSDHRHIPWPEPNNSEMPIFPPAPDAMPSHDGGHWIVGSHPTPRFGGDMFNGPGVCGPPNHPGGGFAGQNFPNNMRAPCPQGGWGPPPNDFGGPHVLLQGGLPPHMGMPGPNMGGPGPNMGGPPVMGGPSNPNMCMQGPPIMSGRGAPRFKMNNWGPQQNSRPCKHFLKGHCRNGNNCRFAHNQHR